jgi:hypothetical protein
MWRGWVDENWEQATVLSLPELSKEEIDRLIDQGLKEFYLRPQQILQMAKAIRTVDDLRRKLYGLRMFIDGSPVRPNARCQPQDFV